MPSRSQVPDAPEAVAAQRNQFATRGLGRGHGGHYGQPETRAHKLKNASQLIGLKYGMQFGSTVGTSPEHVIA